MPWLLSASTLWFSGYALLLPVAPLWAIRGGGGSLGAGLVTAVMMACTVLGQLAMQRVLSGLGWHRTMVLGSVLLGLPALGLLGSDALWAITVLSALRGLGFGVVTVCGATAVAAFVPPARRGRAIGAYGLALAAPQCVLLPLAPWLAERVGFRFVFILAVLPALAIPLTGAIARAIEHSDRAPLSDPSAPAEAEAGPAPTPAAPPAPAASLRRVLPGPLAALAVITAAGGAILTFTPDILTGPVGVAGLLAFTVAAAACRWRAGGIADRLGPAVAIAPLLFIGAAGLVIIGLIADDVHRPVGRILVIAGLLLVGAAYGGLQNLTLTQAFAAAGEAARSPVSVAWNLSFDAGTGVGAFAAGAIVAASSYEVAFIVLAVTVAAVGAGWARPGLGERGLNRRARRSGPW